MRFLISFLIILLVSANVFAGTMSEKDKINYLLDALTTEKVVFIRNGEEHSGVEARKHLQDKLGAVQGIDTAQDFIAKIASSSSVTGEPYMVKFPNGTQIESAKWLGQKLKEIEAKQKPIKSRKN